MSEILEGYFGPKQLELAFHRVICWQNRMIKDLVGLRAFGRNLQENCLILSEDILSGNYRPRRGFKFYMPKASKTLRTVTQLTAEDAIVYQAIANVLAQKAYDKLDDHKEFVFGSVLSPDAKKGVELLDEQEPNYFFYVFWKDLYKKFSESVIRSVEVDKAKYKFETDITGFFDSIPHYNLLGVLSNEFEIEDEVLDILSNCLNIWSGTRDSITPGVGIPQGPAPSYLLANVLLHHLDKEIVSGGYAYYRYMDDIKIYGNDEEKLLKALILVDKYTKGNGLSINSKKTSIEEIAPNSDDETVKAMKRVDLFSMYFGDQELPSIDENSLNKEGDQQKDSTLLSEQDNSLDHLFGRHILTETEEIIEFWQSELSDAGDQIRNIFTSNEEGYLILTDGYDDIDLIRASSKFGSAVKSLRELNVKIYPDESLIPYWLFGIKKFFWRTNIMSYTLMTYGKNEQLKEGLIDLYKHFEDYEWVRFYLITTLSFTQKFSDPELRNEFFPFLKAENSPIVKIAMYRLLFKHAEGKQLLATLEATLKREDEFQIKVVVTDFNRTHRDHDFDVVSFIESIGL